MVDLEPAGSALIGHPSYHGKSGIGPRQEASGPRFQEGNLERNLELTGQERLLLRLVYEENCSIPEAARNLNLNERTARRAHARLMDRLRAALAEQGLDGVRFALAE